MYKLNDMVRVVWEDELVGEPVKIIWVSDDEETFELEGSQGNVFQNVKREQIFEEWETDKMVILLSRQYVAEVSKEEVEELAKEEHTNHYQDKTFEGLLDNISYSLSFDDVEFFVGNEFGYYGNSELLFDGDMYHWIETV